MINKFETILQRPPSEKHGEEVLQVLEQSAAHAKAYTGAGFPQAVRGEDHVGADITLQPIEDLTLQ